MATKWKVRGVYFEACNCEVVCPCIFASRPTNPKNCTVLNGWHIEKGRFGTTDLSGLNVAMAIHSPGHMLQVKWKAALYVDDQAGKSQGNALTKIFSGQAGGHPALLASFVGRLLGVRSVPIEFKARGKKRSMIVISSRSCSANSRRPPVSYNSMESPRCFTIVCSIWRISSSSMPSVLPLPRAAISRSFSAAIIRRTVETARLSWSLSATFRASGISVRSMSMIWLGEWRRR